MALRKISTLLTSLLILTAFSKWFNFHMLDFSNSTYNVKHYNEKESQYQNTNSAHQQPYVTKIHKEIQQHVEIVGVKPDLCCINEALHMKCKNTLEDDDTSGHQFQFCQGRYCLCFKQNPAFIPPHTEQVLTPSREHLLLSELRFSNDPPVKDFRSLPDPDNTKIKLLNHNPHLGETVRVHVEVFDGYNNPVSRGGDVIMGWMQGRAHSMHFQTSDLDNGSYILSIPTYWAGDNMITVELKHCRETRKLQYKFKQTLNDIFLHAGLFKSEHIAQETLCSFKSVIPGYRNICNFTEANNNHPWYCGEPPSEMLNCSNLIKVYDLDYVNFPVTETELKMLKLRNFMVLRKLPITIKEAPTPESKRRLPLCNELSPLDTWNMKLPIGFMSNHKWTPIYCHIHQTASDIVLLLKNTTLHLFGDSTTRQFYAVLKNFTNCQQITPNTTSAKWYEDTLCVNTDWDFRLLWTPHEMPFALRQVSSSSHFYQYSDADTVKLYSQADSNRRHIVILHHYLHFRHPFAAFRQYINHLKNILETLPDNVKGLDIFIKGPHPFSDEDCALGLTDMLAEDFMAILFRELKPYGHKVWYLDYWNMLNAAENTHRHPVYHLVWEMLRVMFGYIHPI